MRLKIDFVDFYKEINKEDNIFINNLRKACDVEVSSNPDLIFFGNYGQEHLKYNCFKIFYSSENIRPDYRLCDFSITFDYLNDYRNFRLPLYFIHLKEFYNYVRKEGLQNRKKTKFCNFIYSNESANERMRFFEILSQYKGIDSPGKVLNNMSNDFSGLRYDYKSKLSFISEYKFTVAFENESYPGYVTEKIVHPLLVGSIPIYWGDPLIHKDFKTDKFINVHDFGSYNEVVDYIKEIDSNSDLYYSYCREFDYQISMLENKELEFRDYFISVLSHIQKNTPISSGLSGDLNRIRSIFFDGLDKINNKVKNILR